MSQDDATQPVAESAEDALFAAVLAHDTVYPSPLLPGALHLDYDQAQLARCFALSRQLWDTPDGVATLRQVARSLIRRGYLDDAEKLGFKHVRARYKQLRFAYVLFDERHRYPRAFDFVTRTMSRFQDALVLNHRVAAFGHALSLRIVLSDPFMKVVTREIAGFRPTTGVGFQDYVRRDVARSYELAQTGRMTGRQFHAVRKTISRQAALYDCLRVLYPSDYHAQVGNYVSTINGLMGSLHDEMVARKATAPGSYAMQTVAVPERITTMLSAFASGHRPSEARIEHR